MELRELKDMWQTKIEGDISTQQYTSEHINEIIMKTHLTVDKLHSTNIFWWKVSKISIAALVFMLLLNVILFVISPNDFGQFEHALPFMAVIGVFGLLSLWINYEQVKIFDMGGAANLRMGIESSIQQFKRFYFLSSLFNLVVLPIVFYSGILIAKMGFFKVKFSFSGELVWQSLIFTAITMLLGHFYYKKTYFRWLAELKMNLSELSQQN